MRNKFYALLAAILLSVVMVAQAADNKPTAQNFTDPNKAIILKPDQTTFMLKLKSNPTTGYSYFLLHYDSNIITPVSRTYHAPEKSMPGAGGYEEWEFKAKPEAFTVPRATVITLVYAKPWEVQNPTSVNFKIITMDQNK